MKIIDGRNIEWRPVKDWPYYVSSFGHVMSESTGIVLKPWETQAGYYEVKLHKNGVTQNTRIHRLVAEAFIPNPGNKLQVNHIDGNRKNNCVNNLEWATHGENQRHRFFDLGRVSTPEQIAAMNEAHRVKVLCVETQMEYPSLKAAGEKTGVDSKYISACINGRLKTAGGFHWKRIETGRRREGADG